MNANWLINMIMRRVIGRLVNQGVDAGFRALGNSSKGNNSKPEMTEEERAERERIRAIRQARRAKRNG